MSGKTLRVAVAGDFCARDMLDTIDAAYARKALRLMQPILDDADLRMINVENAVIEGDPDL